MNRPLARACFVITLCVAAAVVAAEANAGGVHWKVPTRWSEQPARSMRVATYLLPGVKGGKAAECGVFYFGKSGGGIDENIARWSQQFEGQPKPKTSIASAHGISVHRVDISGTYLSPGGPRMQSQGPEPGYRLLGAIVEAPDGLVFFKCVGPADTIAACEKEMDALIASIEKAGSRV